MYKVVFLGDSGVGKTTLISRLMGEEFNEDHIPTNGTKRILTNKYKIVDTCGKRSRKEWIIDKIKNVDLYIVVYDVNNINDSVDFWSKNLDNVMLVGNKSDLQFRLINFYNLEVSAKTKDNLNIMLKHMKLNC